MAVLSLEMLSTLHKLAERANPTDISLTNSPYCWLNFLNNNTNYYKCLICYQKINVGLHTEHGIDHLRQANLLPFI